LCLYLDIIGRQSPQARVFGQGEVVYSEIIGPEAPQARVLEQGKVV